MADLAIKPKNISDDLWIMIQVKSTIKPTRDYGFKCSDRYKNCIILCICQSDKRMWAIDGDTITVKNKIAIGLKTVNNVKEWVKEYVSEPATEGKVTGPESQVEVESEVASN